MDIALLSGADKNAGDFLITKRAKSLLRFVHPEANVAQYKRNESLDAFVDEINKYDYLVFAGGPGYLSHAYPEKFPLVDNLDLLKPKFFALGMGGYTRGSSISGYVFSENTRKLLDRFEKDELGLGCRDLLSQRLLKANGYTDTCFTGCPAWYDVEVIKRERAGVASGRIPRVVHRIAISDPAVASNCIVAKKLVLSMGDLFPDAEMKFVFHRGWSADKHTDPALAQAQLKLRNWLEQNGIRCVDISYSADGFTEYNDVDLHVGFRVHAHIYALSQRIPSFLIEEDGRGYGANEALGLAHIGPLELSSARLLAGKIARRVNKEIGYPGRNAEKIAANMRKCIETESDLGYASMDRAFRTMRDTFIKIERHIRRLG